MKTLIILMLMASAIAGAQVKPDTTVSDSIVVSSEAIAKAVTNLTGRLTQVRQQMDNLRQEEDRIIGAINAFNMVQSDSTLQRRKGK